MRRIAASLALLLSLPAPALGLRLEPQLLEESEDMYGPQGALASHPDTAWFGGGGTGDGTVVRGGTWTWEADSGEPPEFFLDGDPVGNQYRDGWTFEDRSSMRPGMSPSMCSTSGGGR